MKDKEWAPIRANLYRLAPKVRNVWILLHAIRAKRDIRRGLEQFPIPTILFEITSNSLVEFMTINGDSR